MAVVRRGLQAEGLSSSAIETVLKRYEPSTASDYDRMWASWTSYALSNGVSYIHPSDADLAGFCAWLITDKSYGQASTQKALSVVSSTAALARGEGVASLMPKAAAKINKPAGVKYSEIFEIWYIFEYLHQDYTPPTTFLQAQEEFLILLRAATGFRSDDCVGISRESGVRKVTSSSFDGYQFRFWDSKARQRSWSGWTSIPRLPRRFESICVCHRLDTLLEMSATFPTDKIQVAGRDETPLFIWANADKTSGSHKPWKVGTLKNKVKSIFLDNVQYTSTETLSQAGFTAHSFRHANASALRALGVSRETAAQHQQTSVASMEQTYVRPLRGDWSIPLPCVATFNHVYHKLVAPFVHHLTTDADDHCGCASLL